MVEVLQDLISDLKTGLVRIYGKRLKGVYLFGSYARGEQDTESDVDILIVLDNFDRYGAELDRISELNSRTSLEYGLSVSTIFVREYDWHQGESPILRNIHAEAIAA